MDPLLALFVSAIGICAAVLTHSLLKAEKITNNFDRLWHGVGTEFPHFGSCFLWFRAKSFSKSVKYIDEDKWYCAKQK